MGWQGRPIEEAEDGRCKGIAFCRVVVQHLCNPKLVFVFTTRVCIAVTCSCTLSCAEHELGILTDVAVVAGFNYFD